jgi:hypothetical protein
MKLGIDFGKVIMEPVLNGKADTSFLGGSFEQAMHTPASERAFEVIAVLVKAFNGQVWIVSKCGPSVQNKTRAWLEHWDFCSKTGMPAANVRFCLQRHEKVGICNELGITHFIDDRLDVLEPMSGCVSSLYLFGEQPQELQLPEGMVHVLNWTDVEKALLCN